MPDFIIRGSQPIDRAAIARVVAHAFEAVEIDPSDPFLIDDPCEKNGGGPHADDELGINPLIVARDLHAQRGDLVAMRMLCMVAISERGK